MENVLDTLVRDTCGSEAEAGHDGEEIPCREESEGGIDVEYRSRTPGKPDESENIEQDWNMDAVGDEAEDVKRRKIRRKRKENKRIKRKEEGEKEISRESRAVIGRLFLCLRRSFLS